MEPLEGFDKWKTRIPQEYVCPNCGCVDHMQTRECWKEEKDSMPCICHVPPRDLYYVHGGKDRENEQ